MRRQVKIKIKEYGEFGLVNIFHPKYPNNKQFKTYQEGTKSIDYGIANPELIEKDRASDV